MVEVEFKGMVVTRDAPGQMAPEPGVNLALIPAPTSIRTITVSRPVPGTQVAPALTRGTIARKTGFIHAIGAEHAYLKFAKNP